VAANVLPLTEKRLAKKGVKITFFKALVKLVVIESRYPHGLEGFIERYRSITPRDGLIGVTFRSARELDQFVAAMASLDIVKGRDLATANQLHGEMDSCEGIQFITVSRVPKVDANAGFPVWYACADGTR